MPRKKKILMLSDHALSTSGVGTQSRHLIDGLLKITRAIGQSGNSEPR